MDVKSLVHSLTRPTEVDECNRLFSTVKNLYLAVEPEEVVAVHLATRRAEGAEEA
jgi:hypothetical protein